MMRTRSILFGGLFLSALAACTTNASEEESTGTVSSELKTEAPTLHTFRDAFFAYANQQRGKPYTAAEIQSLSYIPEEDVQNPIPKLGLDFAANPEVAFNAMLDFYQTKKPSRQFANGQLIPIKPMKDPNAIFAKSGPVTIVIIPGIFGEMIDTAPFDEIYDLNETSTLRRAYDEQLKSKQTKSRRLNLRNLRIEEVSLGEVVRAGSIDDQAGRPLVNVIFLKAHPGSLETFGTIAQNSELYKERLDTYFKLMGVPANGFTLLGYSRGALPALEMAADFTDERQLAKFPWGKKLTGMISHGGPLYGTPTADMIGEKLKPGVQSLVDSVPENNSIGKLVGALQEIARDLKSCAPGAARPEVMQQVIPNSLLWMKWVMPIAGYQAKNQPHPQLVIEGNAARQADPGRFFNLLKSSTYNTINFVGPAFFDEYCANIDRFKSLVGHVYDGAATMKVANRMQWWRTRNLPDGFRIYTMAATQGDATVGGRMWPNTRNKLAYDLNSTDDVSLRTNYYDLLAISKIELNDGQVPYPYSHVWPELNIALNPHHKTLKSYEMAYMGGHHWAIAFRYAFPMEGSTGNPFPRVALMQAMANYIAQTEASEASAAQ